MILKLHVQPGASRDEIAGWDGDTLRIRIRAKAIEGKANRAVEGFLAEVLGLRPRQVALLRGERSREKLVEVDLPSLEEVASRLGVPLSQSGD
ncbi:MAG TPA: DUF167 domain-containing protein [Chloroflexota bacterium]|nr:DUF167 domain-containing protein [Chloroflexota bacterium]